MNATQFVAKLTVVLYTVKCGASLEVLWAPFHMGGAVLWQKAHSV